MPETERERDRDKYGEKQTEVSTLKRMNIPLGGSEYPSTTNHPTLSSPNVSTWSSFHVSQARRRALAGADTQAFFSNESQIPWNLFKLRAIDWLIYFTCHLQFIMCAASGRPYCCLWTASFSAFIKWLMHPMRPVPSSQLAHLLVAVEKVCAGGVVFAGLGQTFISFLLAEFALPSRVTHTLVALQNKMEMILEM